MKRLIGFIVLIFAVVFTSKSQQDPLKTNYRFNYFVLNPAAAGSYGKWTGAASVRSDFTRFPGSPVTSTASFHGVLGESSGVGFNFMSDVFGPEQSTGIQFNYAYHIEMNRSNLSLGLGARYVNYMINDEIVTTVDPEDLSVFDGGLGDLSFGVMHYSKKHYVGISAPYVVQLTGQEIHKLSPHIYISGGYLFDVGAVSLEPMAMVRIVPESQAAYQTDINLKAWFIDNQLMLGAGWRGPNGSDYIGSGLTFMTGFNVQNKWQFSYAYDMNTSEFQTDTWGSHEVTFGIRFGKQKFDNVFGARTSETDEEAEVEELEEEDEMELEEEEMELEEEEN